MINEQEVPSIKGMPFPVNKALGDKPFQYLAILRNGMVIYFEGASICEQGWIKLEGAEVTYPKIRADGTPQLDFERGLYVRTEEIIAAVEAPHGT